MLKHGVGPAGPGIGETLVDKTARVSSWSRFGRGTRHVAMLNETALTGTGIILGEGSDGLLPPCGRRPGYP